VSLKSDWIKERVFQAAKEDRLAHAYLLCGHSLHALEHVFEDLAKGLIERKSIDHPDIHIVRPESKSRRITIAQVRDLEHALRLKPYEASRKIGGVIAADRLCVGMAEAANAFLKTLEEPPNNSTIILLTEQPHQLLPTIRSRCIALPLRTPPQEAEEAPLWAGDWHAFGKLGIEGAYLRANLLMDVWREARERIEIQAKKNAKEGETEEIADARIESEFIAARCGSLASLSWDIWRRAETDNHRLSAGAQCEALDELSYALSRSVDVGLAVDRCCLRIAGEL
jgi:DNA polymerase-3 subunit delta'